MAGIKSRNPLDFRQWTMRCKQCRQPFEVRQRGRGRHPVFCSSLCASRWRRKHQPSSSHRCVECGAVFASDRERKCCSPACASALRIRGNTATRARKVRLRRSRVCEHCRQPFIMRHHRSGRALRGETAEGRFCSRDCAAWWLRSVAREGRALRDLFEDDDP